MNPEDFISAYEKALASQNWDLVKPLICDEACVTFSTGTVHQGKDNIKLAFEKNFSSIKGEQYKISKVNWIKNQNEFAVFTFEFNWSGKINGELREGNGIGTSVLVKEEDQWKLLSEHLGKSSKK